MCFTCRWTRCNGLWCACSSWGWAERISRCTRCGCRSSIRRSAGEARLRLRLRWGDLRERDLRFWLGRAWRTSTRSENLWRSPRLRLRLDYFFCRLYTRRRGMLCLPEDRRGAERARPLQTDSEQQLGFFFDEGFAVEGF